MVAELPPLPSPEPELTNLPGGHEVAHLDLGDLDESARWRLGLVLNKQHIAHRWNGGELTLPEAAVGVVDDFVERDLDDTANGTAHADVAALEIDASATVLATPARRLLAAPVDWIIATLLTAPVVATWTTPSVRRGPNGTLTNFTSTTTAASWVAYGITVAYFAIGVGRFGTTLAKRGLRMRVVRSDGSKVSMTRAIVRAFVPGAMGVLSAVVTGPPGIDAAIRVAAFFWPVVVFAPILSPQRRGIHDIVADTKVVVARPASQ